MCSLSQKYFRGDFSTADVRLRAQRIDPGYSRSITTCLSFLSPLRVKMGSSVAPLAPLLLLGLISSVWSLNPDDPNVCSHWERWASSTRLHILHCCTSWHFPGLTWSIPKLSQCTCYKWSELKFNIHSQSPYSSIDLTQLESPSSEWREGLQLQMKYAGKLISVLSSQSIMPTIEPE